MYVHSVSVHRDFMKRLFRLKRKEKQQPEDFSDPLEEVYFQTLVMKGSLSHTQERLTSAK